MTRKVISFFVKLIKSPLFNFSNFDSMNVRDNRGGRLFYKSNFLPPCCLAGIAYTGVQTSISRSRRRAGNFKLKV